MKLDLHVHSYYSDDSNSRVKDIIDAALARGLAGIAITDHNSFAGSREALEVNPHPSFLIIPGAEYATEHGHVQGLFISGDLTLDESLRGPKGLWPFNTVVEEIHRQGGITVLAHPFKNRTELPEEVWSKVDAVEIFNSRAAYGGRNRQANDQARETAAKYSLPVTAGSDGHWLGEIGNSYLELSLDQLHAGKLTLAEVREAILSKRSAAHGSATPPWYQGLSQILKVFHHGYFQRLPKAIGKLILTSLKFLLEKK